MYVSNRMTPNPITVSPKTSARKALDIMQEKRFSNIPVVDNGQLQGIIAKEDIINQYFCGEKGCSFLEGTLVEEIMNRQFVTINRNDYLEKAIYLLKEKDINALPVMDNDGKMVGIITRADIFEAFADSMGVDNEGTRIYVVLPDFIGQIAKIANIVKQHGVSIDAMSIFDSKIVKAKQMVMKVNAKDTKLLIEDLAHAGIDVRDASSF
ncbi:MAG TPA: CBS and ACT domain-containing protein [Candidatus Nitrosocosmicus sp.]|nr:CBS and ACT domain-containing protein [Candidatus Nitrosocosmicus sp.]